MGKAASKQEVVKDQNSLRFERKFTSSSEIDSNDKKKRYDKIL